MSSPMGLLPVADGCMICVEADACPSGIESAGRPAYFLSCPISVRRSESNCVAALPFASGRSLGEESLDLVCFSIRKAQIASAHDSLGLACIAGTDDGSGHRGIVQRPSDCDFSR